MIFKKKTLLQQIGENTTFVFFSLISLFLDANDILYNQCKNYDLCANYYDKLNAIAIYDVLLSPPHNTMRDTTQTNEQLENFHSNNAILVSSATLELSKLNYPQSSWTV